MINLPKIDVAQRLEHEGLPMSLPAARFRIPICAGFSEKSRFSPLNIGTLFRCGVFGHSTLPSHASLHLTWV